MLYVCAVLMSGEVFANDAAKSEGTVPMQMISEGDSVPPNAVSDEQRVKNEKLYRQRCGACHALDSNRIGPRHRDIYGQKAGSVSGFNYSEALQNLDVIWTDVTLDEWLKNPTAFAKGTSMGFRLRKASERKAVIQYLKSLSRYSE
ncbi:MAG: cytochrome C [Sneathiella sp.]|nr:cytochrome C [Sneathiella sp.]